MKATLIRFQDQLAGALPGVLVLETGFTVQTLERKWLNNAPAISCIPLGEYRVIPHTSPSRGPCFAILDVPHRTHILIHAGNTVEDTEGCVLVGLERIGDTVQQSRAALRELLARCPSGSSLRIING